MGLERELRMLDMLEQDINAVDEEIKSMIKRRDAVEDYNKKEFQSMTSLVRDLRNDKARLVGIFNSVNQDVNYKNFLLEAQGVKIEAEAEQILEAQSTNTEFQQMYKIVMEAIRSGVKNNKTVADVLEEVETDGKKVKKKNS